MCRSILKTTLAAIIVVASSALLFAQQTGSVVGTVMDKTGAVVASANVTLTNTQTQDVRRSTTNAEGFFAFSGTVAGDYSVKVESPGFQAAEQAGIHISPGDRRNLNVTLGVAATAEHVTVEVNASQVQVVDSGDLSSTLSSKDIGNLALEGRDVTELVRTLPGFNNNTSYNGVQNKSGYLGQITSIQSSVGNGFSGNGSPDRAGGADLISDGAHILDPGCNCNANQTVNGDMVAEVKVTTSSYSADNETGPVVISAVSKSGSSEYHGAAYLHYRNWHLNSNDWIYNHQTPVQPRPQDRYWYPGGQISGPVPFTHKKLTFFTGYEYYNQAFPNQTVSSGLVEAMVPTVSERAGHFDPTLPDNAAVCSSIAGWVSGQYRCQNFTTINTAGGVVSGITNDDVSSYIAPGAKALLTMIPTPNHTPTAAADYNYVLPLITTNNGYMFHGRADYAVNDSTKLYVSYNQQHENYEIPITRWWAPADSIPYVGNPSSSNASRTISGNLVKVFNSTTTNEFLAGLSYLHVPETLGNPKAVSRQAQKYPYTSPSGATIMPSITNSWWTSDLGIPQLIDTGRVYYWETKWQPSIEDNLTKVLKTHTLKFGVSWMRSRDQGSSVGQGNGPNGTVGYGPIWDFSGPGGTQITSAYNPVLDFLLDRPGSFSYAPAPVTDMQDAGWGFYGQDEWKISKRFTLSFGLRLSHDEPWIDATGKYGASAWTQAWYNADVAANITTLPGMRWHAMDSAIPLAGRTLNAMFYAPRFGIAYDIFGNGKTMLRGGFGTYYYRDGLGGSSGTSVAQGGTSCGISGATFLSQIDQGTNVQCAGGFGGVTSAGAVDPNDHVEPRTYTYNFTVSQQTLWSSVLEVSYSGNQTSDLMNPLQNINNVPIGAFMKPDPNPASQYFGQVLSIEQITSSNTINTGSTAQQDYFPLTHYTSLNLIRHNAWANYNALQVTWSKQRGHFSYNLNYTFSKMLGINKTPDPINLQNDYGIMSQDHTHVLNASYSYDVGSRFKSRLGSIVLNGWLVSGITGIQSGVEIPQAFSANLGLQGSNTIPNPYAGSNSNSTDPNTVNSSYYLGTPSYTLMPTLTCNPAQGLKSGQHINPNCFSLPAAPQFTTADQGQNWVLTQLGGQGLYQMPYLRGPAYFNTDLSLARTVKITERQNVQIKFSGFNFLNHPLTSFDQNNANNLNLNYTTGALASKGTGWAYGVPNEKFGRRVLEMSLRYNF